MKKNTFINSEGEEHCAICHSQSNGCSHSLNKKHPVYKDDRFPCNNCGKLLGEGNPAVTTSCWVAFGGVCNEECWWKHRAKKGIYRQ